MTAVGGPIVSVEVDGRYFSVAADADAGRQIGGKTNEVQPNGDNTGRLIKSAKPWMVDGLSLAIDDLLDDQVYLQLKANEKKFFPVNFSFSSGTVWGGLGQIVDELKFSNQNATMPISFSGPGSLTQQ